MFSPPILSRLTEDLRASQARVDNLKQQLAEAESQTTEWSRLIQLAELNSDPEPAGVLAAEGTVPIGGVAPKSFVVHPDWNGGKPVEILTVEDSETYQGLTFVAYRDIRRPAMAAVMADVDPDMQVTPWAFAPAAPAWFGSPGVNTLKEATR